MEINRPFKNNTNQTHDIQLRRRSRRFACTVNGKIANFRFSRLYIKMGISCNLSQSNRIDTPSSKTKG